MGNVLYPIDAKRPPNKGLYVIMNKHARERCEQRGFEPNRVIEACRNVPPPMGAKTFVWSFGAWSAVIQRLDTQAVLIRTVYWNVTTHKRASVNPKGRG